MPRKIRLFCLFCLIASSALAGCAAAPYAEDGRGAYGRRDGYRQSGGYYGAGGYGTPEAYGGPWRDGEDQRAGFGESRASYGSRRGDDARPAPYRDDGAARNRGSGAPDGPTNYADQPGGPPPYPAAGRQGEMQRPGYPPRQNSGAASSAPSARSGSVPSHEAPSAQAYSPPASTHGQAPAVPSYAPPSSSSYASPPASSTSPSSSAPPAHHEPPAGHGCSDPKKTPPCGA